VADGRFLAKHLYASFSLDSFTWVLMVLGQCSEGLHSIPFTSLTTFLAINFNHDDPADRNCSHSRVSPRFMIHV